MAEDRTEGPGRMGGASITAMVLVLGLLAAALVMAVTLQGPDTEESEAREVAEATATGTAGEPAVSPIAATTPEPTPTPEVPGLAMFTNLEAGYEIRYPEGWIVDDRDPFAVVVEPSARNGQMLLDAIKGEKPSEPVDRLLDRVLENTQERMADVREVGRRPVKVPGGYEAAAIELIYDNPNDSGGPLHSTLMLVITDDRLYQVEIAMLDDQYTEEFARQVGAILSSLTIPK